MTGQDPTKGIVMPRYFAWFFFVPGAVFIAFDVFRLQITGLFLLGVVFLVVWAWLIGVFTREFWILDEAPGESWSTDELDAESRAQRVAAKSEAWR